MLSYTHPDDVSLGTSPNVTLIAKGKKHNQNKKVLFILIQDTVYSVFLLNPIHTKLYPSTDYKKHTMQLKKPIC